jgi:hypothetical protein
MIACSLLHIDKLTPQGRESPCSKMASSGLHPRGILGVSTVRGGRELTGSKKRWSLIIKKSLSRKRQKGYLKSQTENISKNEIIHLHLLEYWVRHLWSLRLRFFRGHCMDPVFRFRQLFHGWPCLARYP